MDAPTNVLLLHVTGNLYSHMRRHTGQLYRCQHCMFVTHNKGHLIEHEETHTTTQHECRLCHKMYNTTKSLGNHVKRYHSNTAKGRLYVKEFVKRRAKGPAMLHMCQVGCRCLAKNSDQCVIHENLKKIEPNSALKQLNCFFVFSYLLYCHYSIN